jgi:hypothetical protein
MWFLSLRQPTVAACWSGRSASLLYALLVHVAASTPQVTWRLSVFSPDVAELLALMTMCKASLGPIHFHLDGNVQGLGRLKISCDFAFLDKVMRNNGMFLIVVSSEDDRKVVVICLTLTTSKPRFTTP